MRFLIFLICFCLIFLFGRCNENKNKAESIINEWISNGCVKSKATDNGRGKKTRRNKQGRKNKTQRRKNKTQRRKSKKRKTKRLYK